MILGKNKTWENTQNRSIWTWNVFNLNHFSVCDCECNIYRWMNVIDQIYIYIYILLSSSSIIGTTRNERKVISWGKELVINLYLALEPVEIDLFPLFLDLYALELGFDRFPSLSTLWCLRVLNKKEKEKKKRRAWFEIQNI